MRLSHARLRHHVLRSTLPRYHAARAGIGTRPVLQQSAQISQDQAIRPADPATRSDRVSGDTGAAEGSRRWPPRRPDLQAYTRLQGAVRTKSRCGLLPGPTTAVKSVRRPRSSTRHHPRRQRMSAKSADRVLQPHPATARTRLGAATVGSPLNRTRWQAGQE
jgi:hypothetical protein